MLTIRYLKSFKGDLKRVKRRGYDIQLLKQVVDLLANGCPLPERYHDHSLIGNYSSFRECHITPDWLLIYRIEAEDLTLVLAYTGTHSDIFKK